VSEVARLYRFRATHSLPEFPAPWCYPHEHDYTIELVAEGGTDTDEIDHYWRTLDMGTGRNLDEHYSPTTVENIAEELLAGHQALVRVVVWEDQARWGSASR
jgi:6-pyruvoyl-tetrahydropterin synthase